MLSLMKMREVWIAAFPEAFSGKNGENPGYSRPKPGSSY
jgi:hypothetical protein